MFFLVGFSCYFHGRFNHLRAVFRLSIGPSIQFMNKTKPTSLLPGTSARQYLFTCLQGLLLTLLLIPNALPAQPPDDMPVPASFPEYVWAPADRHERLQVAYFRTSFMLKDTATSAYFAIFADSRYHLLINGQYVNFGPARSYPDHPEYDEYDLIPYLKKGENVIAVKVLSNGTANFQLRNGPPAFIAWGNVKWEDGQHIMNTPRNWLAYQSTAYDAFAPRMNFALPPMEVYDARQDEAIAGWELPGYKVSPLWQACTILESQGYWGELMPRSIPHLTQETTRPFQLLGAYHWKTDEKIYSFQVHKRDLSWDHFRESVPFLGYTYIYSPREQEVEVGIWWGEHFLNGLGPLNQVDAGAERPHRQQTVLPLKAGWNYFFVRRNSFFGKWAFHLAIPETSGIQLSPDKKLNDPVFFMTSPPFYGKEAEAVKAMELQEEDIHRKLENQWTPQLAKNDGNPAINMAWKYFDQPLQLPEWQIDEVAIPARKGTSLIYDFRYKKLGRISIDYEAPEGTILDIGFTEDLVNGQANVMKRNGLYMASRHIATGGSGHMETLRPYGLRYLQINIHGHQGPVKIKKVRVHQQVYPFEEVGQFECSDPLFNKIWEIGWRTLEVCAEDSYTDTPYRERGLYAGDMLPQMGVTLAGSGDLRLVKRSLNLFQDMYGDLFYENTPKHPDEIGLLEDYPLLTLEALSWYVDRTNDLEFAEGLFPNYERLVQGVLARRNDLGLIHNQRVFIEWTQIQKSDVTNTAYQAILARSCRLMTRLAQKLNKPDRAEFYENTYRELRQSIRQHLWNEEKQLYTDGIQEGKHIDHFYPISSVWPFHAGITSDEQESSIFPYIARELTDIGNVSRQKKTTPYGSFYILGALYEKGMAEKAEWFIRKHWGEMVYKHDDTTWENFDDTGIGTLSHAWSAAPTYYLSTQILGVDLGWPHPSDPEKIVIAPQSATVNWAEGIVPHPSGPIRIKWEVRGNHLWLECEVPDGIDWEVSPKGRLAELELWVNGKRK